MRIALSFLTRLPVGRLEVADYLAALGRSAHLFPLVGLLVGLIVLLADTLAGLAFGPAPRAVVAVGAGLWVTGLLHLDGLMDTADGLGSHRSRERMLAIMKDSRVGAMGATAGALALLFRFALLLDLADSYRWLALLSAPVLGRMAITFTAALWPVARVEGGMAASFAEHVGRGRVALSLLLGLGMTGGLALLTPFPLGGLGAWVVSVLVAVLLARSFTRQLGGLTGDTYGAISEAVELAVLACFAVLLGRPSA